MDKVQFGLWLTELREKSGFSSQRQLYIASGVSTSTLSRIEGGIQKPEPNTLKKLAPHLKITYEELMEAAGYLDELATENSSNQIKEAIGDDKELLEFWNELTTRDDLLLMFKQARRLPPDEIKRIIRYIKAIEDEEDQEDF